jgi:hypothetical protein
MAISEIFTNKAGHLYSPDGGSSPDAETALREGIAGFRSGLDGEIPRIEAEGDMALAQGPLTETELLLAERLLADAVADNAVANMDALTGGMETGGREISTPEDVRSWLATQAAMDINTERLNAQAGIVSGRMITNYFDFLDTRKAEARAAKRKADRDARDQMMAALLAQMEALDREIAALDIEIEDILANHLSPDEMAHLDDIDDKDERAREEMRIMREKLERQEITQTEFDRFKERWDVRAEKHKHRADVQDQLNEMKGKSPDEARNIAKTTAENNGALATHVAAIKLLDEAQRSIVHKAVADIDVAGNDEQQNVAGNFELFASDDSAFGNESVSGGSISFANNALPDSPLRDTAPPLSPVFGAAATQTARVEPDAQINLTNELKLDVAPPMNGMG